MTRAVIAASWVVATCAAGGCAMSSMRGPDDSSAGADAAASDAALVGACTPVPMAAEMPRIFLADRCDDATAATCAALGDALSTTGYGRASCTAGDGRCNLAGTCPTSDTCTCEGVSCEINSVCAVDASGSPRCASPCVWARESCQTPAPAVTFEAAWLDGGCTDARRAGCDAYFSALTPPGLQAVSSCVEALPGEPIFTRCGRGDACTPRAGQPPICTCAGMRCTSNQVCARDAAGNPQCVSLCLAR